MCTDVSGAPKYFPEIEIGLIQHVNDLIKAKKVAYAPMPDLTQN